MCPHGIIVSIPNAPAHPIEGRENKAASKRIPSNVNIALQLIAVRGSQLDGRPPIRGTVPNCQKGIVGINVRDRKFSPAMCPCVARRRRWFPSVCHLGRVADLIRRNDHNDATAGESEEGSPPQR